MASFNSSEISVFKENNITKAPIRKEPSKFTINVPEEKESVVLIDQLLSPQRRSAPKTAPIAIDIGVNALPMINHQTQLKQLLR